MKGGLGKETDSGVHVRGAVAGLEDEMRRGGRRRPLWQLQFRFSKERLLLSADAVQWKRVPVSNLSLCVSTLIPPFKGREMIYRLSFTA